MIEGYIYRPLFFYFFSNPISFSPLWLVREREYSTHHHQSIILFVPPFFSFWLISPTSRFSMCLSLFGCSSRSIFLTLLYFLILLLQLCSLISFEIYIRANGKKGTYLFSFCLSNCIYSIFFFFFCLGGFLLFTFWMIFKRRVI